MKNFTFYIAVLIALFSNTTLFSQNILNVQNPDDWWGWDYSQASIREATISLEPKGAYTEVGLYLTMSDEGSTGIDNAEFTLDFNLPQGSIIHDSWLWMPDGQIIVQADIHDISKAWQTYEDIVDRNRDPSILYSKGASNYQIRIFPLVSGEERKIKIAYLSPNNWDSEEVQTWLPLEILRTSHFDIDNIKLIHIPNNDWKNPRLNGIANKEFTNQIDPVFGNIGIVELTNDELHLPITFAVDAPFENNNSYVGKLADIDDNFYQLAFLPPMEVNLQTGKKTMILMDYHAQNTNQSEQVIVDAVKGAMTKLDLSANDFKFGYFNNNHLTFSDDQWLPMTTENIDALMTYSPGGENTTDLISEAIEAAKNENEEVEIILLTSSDQLSRWQASEESNKLLEDIGNAAIRIHIIDFQTNNYIVSNNWGEVIYLTTNHHTMYARLANFTHGSYQSSFDGGFNIWSMCDDVFEHLFYQEQEYDLHVKMDQGFSYNRHMITEKIVNPSKPLVQVGKYIGDFPMQIEFSGQGSNGFVYEEDWILESNAFNSDTLLREMWVGNEINFMEGNTDSGTDVQEIVNLSIEERVLSDHTAFLALDLENGGEICANCWEVGAQVFTGTTDISKEDISITAYPNPFVDFTKIEIALGESKIGTLDEIAIYDLLGRRIKLFTDVVQSKDNELIFTWNGADDSNVKLNAGIYVLSVKSGQEHFVHKLSLLGN